jgi:hypothetical protein
MQNSPPYQSTQKENIKQILKKYSTVELGDKKLDDAVSIIADQPGADLLHEIKLNDEFKNNKIFGFWVNRYLGGLEESQRLHQVTLEKSKLQVCDLSESELLAKHPALASAVYAFCVGVKMLEEKNNDIVVTISIPANPSEKAKIEDSIWLRIEWPMLKSLGIDEQRLNFCNGYDAQKQLENQNHLLSLFGSRSSATSLDSDRRSSRSSAISLGSGRRPRSDAIAGLRGWDSMWMQ